MSLVLVLIPFANQLAQYPQTQIFESIICSIYYEQNDRSKIKLERHTVGLGANGGVDELWCKVDAVQDELASLGRYLQMFNSIPNLLLAVPFGWYADKYDRWPLMFVNLLQLVLIAAFVRSVIWLWQIFSLRTIWMSDFFSIWRRCPSFFCSVLRGAIRHNAGSSSSSGVPPCRSGQCIGKPFYATLAAWLMTITT